ncbi:hypothetical protein TNCV_1598041 [Trichonephila clavipes]|nr:hypothetical protein TNCV_1598041 [Trichonephila clavipes]
MEPDKGRQPSGHLTCDRHATYLRGGTGVYITGGERRKGGKKEDREEVRGGKITRAPPGHVTRTHRKKMSSLKGEKQGEI